MNEYLVHVGSNEQVSFGASIIMFNPARSLRTKHASVNSGETDVEMVVHTSDVPNASFRKRLSMWDSDSMCFANRFSLVTR